MPPAPSQQKRDAGTWSYRPELDGLRTFAVYTVVLFHTGMHWLGGGFIGVDLFFVLSGFLVTQVILAEVHSRGTFSVGGFYSRRVRRLVPAAVVTILVTSLVFVLVDSLPQRLEFVRDAQSALVYLANWNFIAEASDYFAADADKSPFLHFWSLSIEEQFYFLYPLLLILLIKLRATWRRQLVVILGLAAASLAAQVYWAGVDPTRAYYGSDAKLYQILAGAALGMWFAEKPALKGRAGGGLAAVGLASLAVLATALVDLSTSTRGILATAAALATIAGLYSAPASWSSRFLALRVPVYLGKISYGTYLWHWPVILIMGMVLDVRPLVLFLLAASVATGLAALSSEVLEAPIRRLRPVPVLQWPIAVSGLAVGVLLAALVVTPILGSERAPAVAQGVGTEDTAGVDVLEERAAALDRPVPKGLDLATIAEDRGLPDTFCTPDTLQDCLLEDEEGPTVVLVGDSHARMVAPAFQELAHEKGFRLYVSIVSSCPWQAGLINTGSGDSNEGQCREAREDFYEKTLPAMDPDIVVLANFARTGEEWEGRLEDQEGLDLPIEELQQRTAERTANRISDAGARTVIVKTVMGTGGFGDEGADPLDCLARATTLADCAVVPPNERPILDSFYDTLAVDRDDVSTVDVNPLICPGESLCSPIVNGEVVWRNSDHVTAAITRSVRDGIWKQMQDSGALAVFD